MYDINLFAKKEKRIRDSNKTIKIYSQYIEMEFGIKKVPC